MKKNRQGPTELRELLKQIERNRRGQERAAGTLRVARDRLARRVEAAHEREPARQASEGFIELEAGGLCAPVRTVVRFEGRDGEKLELELAGVDVVALARAFWSRPA